MKKTLVLNEININYVTKRSNFHESLIFIDVTFHPVNAVMLALLSPLLFH